MNRLLISTVILAFSSPAFAQKMSPEQIQAQMLISMGQLQQALGQTRLDNIAANAKITELEKQVEEKSPKTTKEPAK